MNQIDPYRPPETDPPTETDAAKDGRASVYAASIMWMGLALFSAVNVIYIRWMFEEFGVPVPVLTRWLLHPMSIVMCVVVALAVLVTGVSTEDPAQRKRTGRIAFVLAWMTFGVTIFGIASPLISLINALSS